MLCICKASEVDPDDVAERESQQSFGALGTPQAGETPNPRRDNKSKVEKKKCGLCKTQQPAADWPINCPHCRVCKRAIDNLAYCARVQHQEEWWKGVRKDEQELRTLVKKYLEQCPPSVAGGSVSSAQKKRGLFLTVRYQEEFRASSAVVNDDEGIMMHKSRYLAWAQTHENPDGAFSKSQAENKWNEMEEAAGLGIWIHNKSGPAAEPLCLRIKTADKVTFRNAFEHAKVQEAQQNRELRRATAEAVEAGRRSLLRDHDRGLGRDGQHQDFGAIAQCMVASSAASEPGGARRDSAFSGSGVFVPNLDMMKEDIAEDKLEAAQKKTKTEQGPTDGSSAAEPGCQGESTPVQTQATRGGSAPTWFDEGAINRAKRSQEQAQAKLLATLEKTLATSVVSLGEDTRCTGNSQDAQQNREVETLKARLKFLLCVLGFDPEAVGALAADNSAQRLAGLRKFHLEAQETGLAELKTAAAGGRAPCIDFQELETADVINKSLTEGFEKLLASATSKDEVVQFCKTLDKRRQPLMKLCKAVSSAAKDVTSAVKSNKRVASQAANAKGAASDTPKRARGMTSAVSAASRKAAVFEVAVASGKQVQIVRLGPDNAPASKAEAVDLSYPVIFSSGEWSCLAKDAVIQAALSQFQAAWVTSQIRISVGRGAQALTDPSSSAVSQALSETVKNLLCQVPADAKYDGLRSSLAPVMFAAAGGREHAYMEKDGCASLRLATQGVREVALFPPSSLKDISPATGGAAGSAMARLCTGLLSAPASAIQACCGDMRCATLGAKDVLHTPPGWVVAERIHSAANKNSDALWQHRLGKFFFMCICSIIHI